MILYFADRGFSILGYASTNLPDGLTVFDDLKTEDVETGVAIFECKLSYTAANRSQVEQCTAVGNYILRKHDSENEFYTIIDSELDTKNQEVYIYAEDAGLDLLNEVVGAYTADQAYPITHYVEKFTYDSGFEIGINEATGLTRTLSWDVEATATERLASVATQFGGFEVSYSFDIKGLEVTNKYINIYKERGKESGVQLRLNNEIDRIVTKKSIANLATALICTGGTPENSETPITLSGYEYDDGDFYVSGKYLFSREALKKWTRYVWNKEPNQIEGQKGHIVQRYSYDTTSQKELCAHAVTELKKLCEIEVNYEIDINMLPENVSIGDRVDIVDDAGELYVSARILKLETSVANETQTAIIGEYLIKNSGISQKVSDLASEFSEFAKEREESDKKLDEASQAAKDAQEAADNAQSAADEAAAAAAQAKAEAANASAQLEITETKAETAIQKAEAAQSTAEQASTEALDAKSTADAAKLDAAAAQEDINSLGDRLTTVTTTMEADYARKTDLTEAEAHLQSQISQNAAEISSTVTKVQKIDETVNNAAEQAAQAQSTAQAAQEQANQAVADAEAAQTAATNAQTAATNAQNEANTAKQAAADAQSQADTAKAKADQAQTDLDEAKANLETVSSKVDATEAEVAAAQQAVIDAQAAADQAAADSTAAQAAADQAAADAAKAQTVADNAKTASDNAKAAADQAQADADAAQAAADALAVRVTTAETKITQNAEKIELAATKTEVTETLGGYYTKEQADAAIQLKADLITQSVSNTYATKNELENSKSYTHIKYSDDGRSFTGNLLGIEYDLWKPGNYSSSTTAFTENPDSGTTTFTHRCVTDVFPVTQGQKFYQKTGKNGVYILMRRYDSSGNHVSGDYDPASVNGSYYTVTSGVAYIRVMLYSIADTSGITDEAGWKAAFNSDLVPEFYDTAAEKGSEPGEYIGTLIDSNKVPSDNFSDYRWKKFTGNVDSDIADIREIVSTQSTTITQNCEAIILEALDEYTTTGDFESFKETVSSQLTLLSDQMELKFTETTEQLESVNDDLQEKYNTITKYFTFNIDGLTIGQEDNPNKVVIDNDEISILVNDVVVQKFDANGKALIPELEITKSVNLFGLLISQDENGNINGEKAG